MSGQSAPPPTRGPSLGGDDEGEEEEGGGASVPTSLADLMPKVGEFVIHVFCCKLHVHIDECLAFLASGSDPTVLEVDCGAESMFINLSILFGCK